MPAGAGMHQSPIVDQLWSRRVKRSAASAEPLQRVLTPKRPEDSANSVTYEFSNPEKKWLVEKYRNPMGLVRPGRMFEDLDALAGTIAFEHCNSADSSAEELHIVTASVDRVRYLHRPNLKDDLMLSGQVTWVGRSSMEIGMRATAGWSDQPFMEALFTFVAREKKTGRAVQINPLVTSSPEHIALFKLGEQRDKERKVQRQQAKNSVVGSTLDEDGIRMANALLEEAHPLLSMPLLANPSDVLLSDTQLQNTFLTMPQHRNTAGRIFGGFLMRRAYELARSTAHLFGGRQPIFHELDRVAFKSPVSIGDMVRFDSCILYTSGAVDQNGRATLHTEVRTYVLKPEQKTVVESNIFNFTFGLAENLDGTGPSVLQKDIVLRRVLPATQTQAFRIVEQYLVDLHQAREDDRIA